MKAALVVFVFLSALFSGGKTEVWKFKVNFEKLQSCEFSGPVPCILLGKDPVLLIFRPGDIIELIATDEESEVAGALVTIKEYRLDTSRLTNPAVMKDQQGSVVCAKYLQRGKTCFYSYGATNTSIIAPAGMGIVETLVYIGRTPAIGVTPTSNVEMIEE